MFGGCAVVQKVGDEEGRDMVCDTVRIFRGDLPTVWRRVVLCRRGTDDSMLQIYDVAIGDGGRFVK